MIAVLFVVVGPVVGDRSGATTTAVAASGLPPELGDSSAVCRGRASCGGFGAPLLLQLL